MNCIARRSRPYVLMLLLLPLAGCTTGGLDVDHPPGSLPAYAHNDYKNRKPLWDALRLGYRGVEADYFGDIQQTAHDSELRSGRDSTWIDAALESTVSCRPGPNSW